MQRFEVSGAVRPIYGSLGVKRLSGYLDIFARNGVGKQRGCVAYHSLPSSTEAKNEWSPTSTPICLHGVYCESSTFVWLIAVCRLGYWFT